MGCDDFREEDFLLAEDWEEIIASRGQSSRLISVEEMRDMICEEIHELNRSFVYSRLLEMGLVFHSCDFFSLIMYFDNLYMFRKE